MKILGWMILLLLVVNGRAASYSTTFPNTEVPLSEGGHWIEGGLTGRDWKNVNSLPGMAYGTQTGQGGYDDSTAVLSGSWGSDQSAQATVVVRASTSLVAEVELRLRTSISPGQISGYEFNYSIANGQAYCQIVRWNGPLGNFTFLDGREVQVKSGDLIGASAIGNRLTTLVNGKALFSVTDGNFAGGSPGIGFYVADGSIDTNFGLTNFSATDGGAGGTPSPSATPAPYSVWEASLLGELGSIGVRQNQINTLQSWLTTHSPTP